jgi:RHS repeat-associated protein
MQSKANPNETNHSSKAQSASEEGNGYALGRVIQTDLPDGNTTRVEFTPWLQKHFDQNDTADVLVTGTHSNTPTRMHLDSIGRTICTQAESVDGSGNQVLYETHIDLDLEGNVLQIQDARENPVMQYKYGIYGEALCTLSMDAGVRYVLLSVEGQPVYTWDARGHRMRAEYDALRRPVGQWLQTGYNDPTPSDEVLVGKMIYGENFANLDDASDLPENHNLRGQVWKSFDQSGLQEAVDYDFKGNLLESSKRFSSEYKNTVDFNVADPENLLEAEEFTTTTQYDALNRAISMQTPHHQTSTPPGLNPVLASEIIPVYNEAGLLNQVDVKHRGATTATSYVSNIDYNEKGQRTKIQYSNGVVTTYEYDPDTFRLTRLLSTRNAGADVLQDLHYSYDPVGNITQITDNAQQTIFYNGQVVSPSQSFTYDPLYRLNSATGREHIGQNSATSPEVEGFNLAHVPLPGDATAMRNYSREYAYDQVGNILSMIHVANNGNWTRNYSYNTDNNRLASTVIGSGTPYNYSYNEHGSMISMSHLNSLEWNYAEQLSHISRGTTEAWYNYDSQGQRARKVVEKNGASIKEERLYLGGFEIYRKWNGTTLTLERETLHVMDDTKRIAQVETKTVDTTANGGTGLTAPVITRRYVLDNHLGSASLEVDESASIISYEEYYPYGSTSYQSGDSATEVQRKRYRYTGKEKDEESGLYYHGARYYAAWLGRWTASDPIGVGDGVNLYGYVSGNPVRLVDPSGTEEEEWQLNTDKDTNKNPGQGSANADTTKGKSENIEKPKSLNDYVDAIRSIEDLANLSYEDRNERVSMVSRLLRDYGGYEGVKWNLTSGSVDSDFREQVDLNLPEAARELSKEGAFDKINDPVTHLQLDLSHMQATLSSYLYNTTGRRIRMELAGWAGDMHTYSADLAEFDQIMHIADLDYFAAEHIGSTSEFSESFSKTDLLADVDARNIAVLVKQKGMSVADAIGKYYLGGGVQKRFSSFIDSYGGLKKFASIVNSYETSPLNQFVDKQYKEAAQFGLINQIRKLAENE